MKTTSLPNIRRSQLDRSADSRARLINAAVESLHTVGFANTTTALIAKKAGVTTGALHHQFASKDELMIGVLDHVAQSIRHRAKEERLTSDGTMDVGELVRHLWRVYGNPSYWATWEIIIGTRSDPVFHQRVVAHRQKSTLMRSSELLLHPWIRKHVFDEQDQSDLTALFDFLLIAIRGLSLERFLDMDEAYFERNLTMLAELVEQRLKGLEKNFVQ